MQGPFYIWSTETDEEREEALRQIAILNGEIDVREKALNAAWKTTAEWRELREHELQAGREMKAAAKLAGTLPGKATHSYKGKKFKLNNIPKGKKGGIDAWRYIKHVARPLLWPACKERLAVNPDFILMEDNAASHHCWYTDAEREKEGIRKMQWPPISPDFNPIERVWYIMKSRIQIRRGSERVTTAARMRVVLQEEWNRITIEEINALFQRLPTVMQRCIAVDGGNNFHG